MKNNKGFTLIELLAVLVIIGIIITIIASRGFTAFNNAKKSISEINKKVILDSANIVMEDIKACDDSMDNSTIFSKDLYKDISRDFSNCKDLITSAKVGLNLSIEGMKKQNYLSINDLEDASKYTDEYVNVKGILKENPDTKEYRI